MMVTEFCPEPEERVAMDYYNEEPFTRETFLKALAKLHIGEWDSSYSTGPYGYVVCDGTQWELDISYSNGTKSFRVDGDNVYPYNFAEFTYLFGIDHQ